MIWSTLVHLSTNFWFDEGNTKGGCKRTWRSPASPDLRWDRGTWNAYLQELKAAGCNAIMLDVGDGVVYRSHPEIAVRGALTREEFTAELDKMREMGFEIIPKLNFSSTHDVWLKDYARMLSTPVYYQVCKDIIDEVIELCRPRFLHLGMDEEVYANQKDYNYVVVRQGDLWWHDFRYLVDCVEAHGVRAMMWSDLAREHPEEMILKCPRSVVQCVWYYFNQFAEPMDDVCRVRVRPFAQLAAAGFDVLASGSVEYYDDNLEMLAAYCRENVPQERLLGFAQTTWAAVTPQWKFHLDKGTRSLANARKLFEA